MNLPEIGVFSPVEQLQCQLEEQQNTSDSTSAGQATVALVGGTLVAALLVCSLLPHIRARNKNRRLSRLDKMSKDGLGWRSDQSDIPTTPTTANGASRRMWKSCDCKSLEPVGSYGDGLTQRKTRQVAVVNENTVSDPVSEPLLAKFPDFNDERGWRDFFDSQIYHNEHQDKQQATTNIVSNLKTRGGLALRNSNLFKRMNLRRIEIASTAVSLTERSERYKTIRDRIDRAAIEAAIDDAQSFDEFWQM